jgi:SNF2 family DNA or RNA helicase
MREMESITEETAVVDHYTTTPLFIPAGLNKQTGYKAPKITRNEQEKREKVLWSNTHEDRYFCSRMNMAVSPPTSIRYITEDDPRIIQPNDIITTLVSHQLSVVHEMYIREMNMGISAKMVQSDIKGTWSEIVTMETDIGILADTPGKGKTLCVLALIANTKEIYPNIDRNYAVSLGYSGFTSLKVRNNTVPESFRNTTVIVVPSRLVKHWSNEIVTKTRLSHQVYKSNKILEKDTSLDILIVSSSNVKTMYDSDPEIVWRRIVYDEPDTMQGINEDIMGYFRWFVTASYERLLGMKSNRVIKRLLCMPIFTANLLVVKCNEKYISASASLPQPKHVFYHCREPTVVKIARDFITDEVGIMLSAGDVDAAIYALGGNAKSSSDIMRLLHDNTLREIGNRTKELEYVLSLEIPDNDKRIRTERIIESTNHLRERLTNINKNIESIKEQECLICCDVVSGPVMVLCCNTIYCGGCLVGWFNQWLYNKCPVCMKEVTLPEVVAVTELSKPTRDRVPKPLHSKSEALKRILIDDEVDIRKRKIIIFAIYGHDTIRRTLDDIKLEYIPKDTRVKAQPITSIVRAWKSNEYNIIILSPIESAGLTLMEATDVIIFHKLSPELEAQAIGRAQRIGRVDILRVHSLIDMKKK